MTEPIFLAACARKPTARTPVWYMRQAGRSLPEYRALKEKYDVLTMCRTPELSAEVTLMPVRRLGVDAAILFADIMLPLIGMGVDLKIVEAVGPVIAAPVRDEKSVDALRALGDANAFDYLAKTIGILRKELPPEVPLIGFSGAPFTLASYLIEGKPSREFAETKRLMYGAPETWHALMQKLTDATVYYLTLQAKAGVQAIQVFDSWAGYLSKEDYVAFVLPYSRAIFAALKATNIPRIHFGTNTQVFLEDFASVDCEVVGVDSRIAVGVAWQRIGKNKAIQGNLDPTVLLCDFEVIKKKVDDIFAGIGGKRDGFIFNLGHGVLPQTPLENLIKLTEYVHGK